MSKKYWQKICEMQERQTQKGISRYGQILEENKDLDIFQVLEYLQEELIDALMYIEHIKKLMETMKEEVDK